MYNENQPIITSHKRKQLNAETKSENIMESDLV